MDRTRYNDYTVFYFLGVKMKFSAIKYHHVGRDLFLFYPFYVSFYVILHNILFCFLRKRPSIITTVWPLRMTIRTVQTEFLLRRDKIEKSENGKSILYFNLSFFRFNDRGYFEHSLYTIFDDDNFKSVFSISLTFLQFIDAQLRYVLLLHVYTFYT